MAELRLALSALVRAELRVTKITLESKEIIEITTIISIRVNPRLDILSTEI
jgi:hypothetical protein